MGGVAEPKIVDAGVEEKVQDAGVKKIKDPVIKDPPKGKRAEAEKVYRAAHQKFVEGDCDGAMQGLIQAGKLDPSYPEPLKDVAMCAKKSGNANGACSAAKEYATRKKMSGKPLEDWLKVMCPGG